MFRAILTRIVNGGEAHRQNNGRLHGIWDDNIAWGLYVHARLKGEDLQTNFFRFHVSLGKGDSRLTIYGKQQHEV